MTYPRTTAAIFLFLLIGSLSLLCVGMLNTLEPTSPYDGNVEHVEGKIVAISSGMNFVLETANGQYMHFHCGSSCRTSLEHLRRHLHERADTFVYYTEGPRHSLLVVNVD